MESTKNIWPHAVFIWSMTFMIDLVLAILDSVPTARTDKEIARNISFSNIQIDSIRYMYNDLQDGLVLDNEES